MGLTNKSLRAKMNAEPYLKDGRWGISVEEFIHAKSRVHFTGESSIPVSELDKAKHQRDPRSLSQRIADYDKAQESMNEGDDQ